MTDTSEILEAVRAGKTAPEIAREMRQPLEYVRSIIDRLRDNGLLPEGWEW